MSSDLAAPAQKVSLHRWDVSGRYRHPHWLVFLCSGLADRGLSVVDGHAVRRGSDVWEGHLDVDASDAVTEAVDVAELASTPPAGRDSSVPVLREATVLRRVDGLLSVDVTADDELGLLGRFLRRVSVLTLLPVEMTIATQGGLVRDRFVLGGIGGRSPSEEVQAQLERVLAGLVVG